MERGALKVPGAMDMPARAASSEPIGMLMREPLHAAPETPLRKVLADLTARRGTVVVAVHEGRPTGVFSERDAVRVCLDDEVSELQLGQACSGQPLMAGPDTDFVSAYRAMVAAGVRHLLVVDKDETLLGIVEESDLVGRFDIGQLAELDAVSRLMSQPAVSLEPSASLRRAAQVLKRHGIGSVVVERAHRAVGIVTLSDLTRALAAGRNLDQVALATVMSEKLLTVAADESVFVAARRMRDARVRHLVVTDGARIAGVITEHDILQALESRYSDVLRRIVAEQAREIEAQRRRLSERDLLDQLLSRSHGLGLILMLNEGRVAFVNAAARSLLDAGDVGEDRLEALARELEPANRQALLALATTPCERERSLRLVEPGREIGVRAIALDHGDRRPGIPGLLLVLNDETLAERAEEILEFNQHVVREMPQMVIWIDQAGEMVHANAAVHESLGYAPGTLLGSPLGEIVCDIADADVSESLAQIRKEGSQVFQCRLRARDGRLIPVEVFSSQLIFRGRKYYGGFIRDLTDQQVVERALEESQERLLALVQASPDFIVVKDGDDRWQVANKAGLEMYGLAHVDYHDCSEQDLLRQCPPAYAESLRRNTVTCAQAWRERKPVRIIHTLPHADGGTRYLDMIKVPIFDEQGARKALVVIGRDVTERIRAEQERDASDERLRAAVAAMDDLLLVLDAQHAFVDHYPRSGEALRLHHRGPLIGKPIEAALPRHVVALYEKALGRLLKTGRAQGFDYALASEAGTERWFSARLSAQPAGADEQRGFTMMIRDISERQEAEARIQQLNETLEERVAQRTSEMQSALSELESFSYSISHDLRTPLRAIEGFSRLLETDYGDGFDDAGRDYLSRIRLAAQRMASLIDDLLDLARLSRKSVNKEPVSLSEIASEVVEELRERQPWREVSVRIEENLRACADPVLLRVVFDNLIGNAWKFTDGTGNARIEIGREKRGDGDTFFVRDNGAGFDMAYVDRLFKPFHRLHAQSEFEGTGIGLATIDRIVKRHGGLVSAEGRPGEGACFRFTLSE